MHTPDYTQGFYTPGNPYFCNHSWVQIFTDYKKSYPYLFTFCNYVDIFLNC